MSIRRKSTTHDLATLRLHPDGSRVQQSSVNTRYRTAGSTVIDSRGNWIAKDAGGKGSVKKRRSINSSRVDGADGEFIDLSGDEERTCSQSKGKQRAHDNQAPEGDSFQELELERLNTRTRQRLSFTHDLSFLDPPPLYVSSLAQDTDHSDAASAIEFAIAFPDPASDLLKSIHHFASCYYQERGQLFDGSRDYREKKKERHQRSQGSIHTLAANTLKHQDIDSEAERTETEDETTEEHCDENETMDADERAREGRNTKVDTHGKDMYKAFDGSALMAIGIALQEYIAHTISLSHHTSEEHRNWKRRRIE